MSNILSKLFTKFNINGVDELNSEEKVIYENWQNILSKEELTLADIKNFCQTQVDLIEAKWRDYGSQNKANLIPYHTVYKTLLLTIDSPKVARESLEKQLNELLKNAQES